MDGCWHYVDIKMLSLDAVKEVTLPRLLEELESVVDWFHFGVMLGVPDHTLMMIKIENQYVTERKTQALIAWMREKKGSWSEIVRALVGIRQKRLAVHIAEKYGELEGTPSTTFISTPVQPS